MGKLILFFKVFILLFIYNNSKAQQYNFFSYSIESGLSQSTVQSIFQDSHGYIWVGTQGGGIAKFDGVKFKVYNKRNALSGNNVKTIIEDKNGLLWIGSDQGINTFDGSHFKNIKLNASQTKTVYKLFKDKQNNIWASFPGLGLLKFKNETDTLPYLYNIEKGLSSNYILDIYENKSEELILATYGGGINILNTNTGNVKIISTEEGLPTDIIFCIEKDLKGNFWFGTINHKPFSIHENILYGNLSVNSIKVLTDFPETNVYDINLNENNELLFATGEKGMISYNSGILKHYNTSNGLANNQIVTIFKDKDNIIWLGTAGSGLCKFAGKKFSHITSANSVYQEQILNITQDKDGVFWLASSGNGLVKINVNNNNILNTKNYTTADGLTDNFLTALCFDKKNKLWIGSKDNGVITFDGQKFNSINSDNGLSDNKVHCIFIDSKQRIWIGTSDGITMIENNHFNYSNESNGLINNEVQSITEDKSGNIWIGTLAGIAMFDGKQMYSYDEKDGLAEKIVNCLTIDNDNNLIVGTSGSGVFKSNLGKNNKYIFKRLISENLLSSNNIAGLIYTDKNTLFISTDKGINKVLFSNGTIKNIQAFDQSDGFIGIENNINAIYKDQKKNIWFGTIKGATIYNPNFDIKNETPPKISIIDIKLFFQPINWSDKTKKILNWFSLPDEFTFPHNKNHLTFNFHAINYTNATKVKYKYILEGLDEKWSPETSSNEAVYSSLEPGHYVFKVVACNEAGIWTETPASISFTITPPFYKTWWFILICAIVVALIIYLYIKWSEAALKKENIILESTVLERTSKIIEQKKEIEHKNQDIMDSILYARRIQKAILPSEEKLRDSLNCMLIYQPKDIISGDFYFFVPISKDGLVILDTKESARFYIIAAVDCTGHGVPGALMSMIGYNGLNYAIGKSLESGIILDELSLFVEKALALNSSETIKDGMDISLCVIDIHSKTISYSGANNPLYLIRNNEKNTIISDSSLNEPTLSSSNYSLYEIKADKQPIGIFDNKKNFTKTEFRYKTDDTIYLFTDGYADQFGGPVGKKFKYSRFKNILISNQDKSITELKHIIQTEFTTWKGDLEQVDDVCIVGIRF